MSDTPPAPAPAQNTGLAVLITAAILVGGWWFLFGRGGSAPAATPEPRTAQSYVDEYGGSRLAVESILAYSDCDTLARTFDAALANAHAFGLTTERGSEQRGRAEAAFDRGADLGCPEFD